MSEIKLPRLLGAAREFNIGQETLIDFLVGKGFDESEMYPSAKLTEPMYIALQQAFLGEKTAKAKSNSIDLPKKAQNEKRRRDEEDLGFRKAEKKFITNEVFSQLPLIEKTKASLGSSKLLRDLEVQKRINSYDYVSESENGFAKSEER